MKNKQSVPFSSIWKTLKPFIAPYKWSYLGAIVMVVITCIVLAVNPSVEGGITSSLLEDVMSGTGVRFDVVLRLLVTLFCLFLTKTVAQIIETIWLTNAIQSAMHDLRDALHQKIHRLPVRYFDHH